MGPLCNNWDSFYKYAQKVSLAAKHVATILTA